MTLTGTAPDGSTVTVSDGGAKALGTATASSTGTWSFTTAHLSAGSYAFTATDTTTSTGNVSTPSSPLNVKVNANLIGAVTIGTGATLELAAADSASVTFNGSTGTLILESPSTFSGEIFNFTGNGSLSGSDQIDLTNINFNSVKDSYANGVLTVTDGTNTDKLNFNGSYKLANFDFASDGSGGTIVYDPPVPTSNVSVPTSSGQTSGGQGRNFTGTGSGFEAQDVFDLPGIAFDAQATLGYLPGSNQTRGYTAVHGRCPKRQNRAPRQLYGVEFCHGGRPPRRQHGHRGMASQQSIVAEPSAAYMSAEPAALRLSGY